MLEDGCMGAWSGECGATTTARLSVHCRGQTVFRAPECVSSTYMSHAAQWVVASSQQLQARDTTGSGVWGLTARSCTAFTSFIPAIHCRG